MSMNQVQGVYLGNADTRATVWGSEGESAVTAVPVVHISLSNGL